MHRMMGPLPPFLGGKSNNNKSTAFGQSATLSSKEKKYMSNVEKALQSFESVDEWADYIAFLMKLQNALQSNPDKSITNWIPFDFRVSITLSKCISPSLPSGVHKKTIEVFNTIFDILQTENMSQSITLWLPAILPLMSYASISIKQDLLDLYNKYICKIDPIVIRSCFKSLLLSLLSALDDTTSEFFDSSLSVIESLKNQLNDITHFWQCMLLTVITSPDKRVGAMEYLTRKLPSFIINEKINDDDLSKDKLLSLLTLDGVSCLTPTPGLLIKAFCKAMDDDNLFVQRGFFDLLLTKLPLNSPVFEVLVDRKEKELLFLYVTNTVLKKDMSLNRRLWNWLLGPEPASLSLSANEGSSPHHLSRLDYFKKYSYPYLLNSLLNLVKDKEQKDSNVLIDDFIRVCNISVSIMDKWEIGQSVLPELFIPILQVSKYINDNYPLEFDNVIKYSNELFDGIETNIIWSGILKLLKNNDIHLVLFILKNYNVEDEDMVITHVPLILLSAFSLFKYDLKWTNLIESLIKLVPQRALLPFELSDKKFKQPNYYTDEVNDGIVNKINNYYLESIKTSESLDIIKPFENTDFAGLYLGFTAKLTLECLKNHNSIFLNCTKIFEDLVQTIPNSKDEYWDMKLIRDEILGLENKEINIEVSFGISYLFKYLIKGLNKLEILRLLKITTKSLWKCLEETGGKYQVEIVKKIWNLEMIVGASYLEATICELLLQENNFENRIQNFNILWMHLNDDSRESKTILHRPLYLILEEMNNDIYLFSINKWLKSTNHSGTLNKIFQIVSSELFINEFLEESFSLTNDINKIDFKKISYDLEIIFNLLNLNDEILNNFKLELCVIDNNKQIELIKARNWNISTYKSFMIIVLTKFMEMDTTAELITSDDIYLDYLKCVRLSLKVINLLIDGNEVNFNRIFQSLINNCEENCMNNPNKSAINSYYLESISKMVKLSIKKNQTTSIFDIKTINLLDFLTIGIKSSSSCNDFNNWIELILSIAEYYPDIIFQISNGLIDCICSKIEIEYLPGIRNNDIFSINDPVCELILGMEQMLMKCHKHLGYILSDIFGLNNINNNSISGSSKENGFFGSVIQGVFQLEATDDKNEGTKRKRYLIESFRRSIFTVYQIWTNCEKKLVDNSKLNDLKTLNYCFNKIKFRCKKLIEQNYLLEPLETIESLIECYENNEHKGFKLFENLDVCKQKIILPYILDSIISRVNYLSLEEQRRSSLISKLNEFRISSFLIEYCKNLKDDENLELIWNDIQSFFKDTFSNISYYKYIYPNLLRFLCLIGVKVQNTKLGKNKKNNKDISDNFIKLINLCITIKIGSKNQNTLSNIILQNNDSTNEKEQDDNENKEKIIFRDDVCIALIEIVPSMKSLITENDKLITIFSNIINGISGHINKSGNISFDTLSPYIVELLATLSSNDICKEIKIWKNFVYEILNDSGFFKMNTENLSKWDIIMKNWILNDENRLNDIINSKLTFLTSSTNSAGTLLFNWNDEAEILNGNIPYIKRIIYLLLINEKDTFIGLVSNLINKINEFFKAFRQMTKYCLIESWILTLLRCLVLKFNESHLINCWTLLNKSMFYIFNEVYQEEIGEEGEEGEEKKDNNEILIFNKVFLQSCKLLDVLVILNQEEFQLSEWIFISDNIDGIFKSIKDGNEIGIVEKLSKRPGSSSANLKFVVSKDKKVPMLKDITDINNILELKRFFSMIKINKYETEYDLLDIDYSSIEKDIFNDLFIL